jgi:hypothetical protein
MIIGAAVFAAGLLISFISYNRASSSPPAGSYIAAFGPMIAGLLWFVRGTALVARARRPGR